MSNVTFTKNVTPANRAAGLALIDDYWSMSILQNPPYYPITNETDFIAFLDNNYTTYIEFLGETSFQVPGDKMHQAIIDLANKKQTNYPRPSDFAKVIIANTGWDTMAAVDAGVQAIKDTTVEVAQDVVSVATTYTKYLPYAIGAIGLIAVIMFLRKSGAPSIMRANPRRRK